ncbi:GntR family transcriptional regulator [Steroidobacter flavus]|uniref:GntR family transcriptional regulator n=1 Tax=Steroidobacter flavus TaxID=1842136 RepID=A0ABV8SZ04_9GAMM
MAAKIKRSTRSAVRKPKYQQMAAELREGILRGDYRDLDQFPTENVLCKRYGVSRYTVREALRSLQLEGLIERTRGSGTTIQPATARSGSLYELSSVREILQYARDTKSAFTPMGITTLPKEIAANVGAPSEERWFHFRGLRTRPGQPEPIALTDAYIHPDFQSVVDKIKPNGLAIFAQLEKLARVKMTHVTQNIKAVAVSNQVAAELGIPRKTPCLHILRCYMGANDRLFEISSSYHPADRFVYSMHIDLDK